MICRLARHRFSELRDGSLSGSDRGAVSAHLDSCAACAAEWRSFGAALDGLADLPRLECSGEIAARVFDRLDMENRKPGLAMLFRPLGAARPLFLPSLMASAMLLATALAVTLVLEDRHEPLPLTAQQRQLEAWTTLPSPVPDWGTETEPLFLSAEVSTPRPRHGAEVPAYLLEPAAEGTVFVETVVARDGTVSAVRLVNGDSNAAEPLLEALRRQRFEPSRYRGRPVAVSVYQLISRMDVRAPLT
jgi:hypothetical protein